MSFKMTPKVDQKNKHAKTQSDQTVITCTPESAYIEEWSEDFVSKEGYKPSK